MRRVLFYLVTLWILLWIQSVSNHFLGGTLFAVQWILMGALHFGLTRGPWAGECVGFIWGLFLDAASMGQLGIHAILFAVAGYAAGMFRRQLDSSKVWTQAIFTWMVSMVYFGLYLLVERFLSAKDGSFQWAAVTVPFMNALVAPVVFRALEGWAEAWDMAPVEH